MNIYFKILVQFLAYTYIYMAVSEEYLLLLS